MNNSEQPFPPTDPNLDEQDYPEDYPDELGQNPEMPQDYQEDPGFGPQGPQDYPGEELEQEPADYRNESEPLPEESPYPNQEPYPIDNQGQYPADNQEPYPNQESYPIDIPENPAAKKKKIILAVVIIIAVLGALTPFVLRLFLAKKVVSTLESAQANTQRRNDYSQLTTDITSYMTNHNGFRPPVGTINLGEGDFKEVPAQGPSGKNYRAEIVECTEESTNCDIPTTLEEEQVYVVYNSKCGYENGASTLEYARGYRAFSIYGYQSTGTYCQSSV